MKEYDKPVHIKCGKIINCAGPWAGKLADMAGVGTDREDANPLLRHKVGLYCYSVCDVSA